MTITAVTHLNFNDGQAKNALAFYADVFEGKVLSHTHAEYGMPADRPDADRLAYGQVAADNGFLIMAYDIPGTDSAHKTFVRREHGVTFTNQASFVSLRAGSLEEVQGLWNKLVLGGSPIEELAASSWSAGFGVLADKFGVTWLLSVHQDAPSAA